MRWKYRLVVVTLLSLALAVGLVAPAALGSENSSPDRHPSQGDADERLGDAMADLVQEGVINQEQADIVLERVTRIFAIPPREPSVIRGRLPRPPAHHHRIAQRLRGIIEQTVGLLGLGPGEIVAQLQEGKTLAEVAEPRGVDVETLVRALTADAEARAADAVASGRRSQAEAGERLERLRDEVTRLVTHALPMKHRD